MATLTRVTGKVFGGNAPLAEIGVFGSAKAGNPTNNQDVATIQGLTAYLEGWGSGIVSNQNFPPMEEVTGVLKTISYQACYLLQEGIPVYDAGTEYSATSIVKNFSGNILEFYKSLVDGNIGNPLTDNTKWVKADIVGTREIGVPQITLNQTLVNPPTNCIWLEGAEVSRTDYATLFSLYGTTYGAGDGATTFNLPDFRNRYLCGVDNDLTFGYISAALPDLGLATTSNGAHTHARGTMNITGTIQGIASPDANSPLLGTGAFSAYLKGESGGYGTTKVNWKDCFNFNASNSWTGVTSSNGAHTHAINSSNAIVGASNTVKVDGIKVRFYARYQ